jgi:hypothetical protein
LHEKKRQQNHKKYGKRGKGGFAEALERLIASRLVGPSKKGKADNQGSFQTERLDSNWQGGVPPDKMSIYQDGTDLWGQGSCDEIPVAEHPGLRFSSSLAD